jgi:hypothetical protein
MESSEYINPAEIIYLFKLKWFYLVNNSAYNNTLAPVFLEQKKPNAKPQNVMGKLKQK